MSVSRVLVIDDSTTLRKLVEIAMRGTGFDIDFAATGSDGVTRARSSRPDVILLDYLLPDLESTEVVQLLSDDQVTALVPVVVMSANEVSIFDSFRKFPAVVDFVGKPFTPAEIRSRLESAIKGTSTAPLQVVPESTPPPMPAARARPRTRQTIAPPMVEGAPTDDLQLRGNLMQTPLLELLRLLASSAMTGSLTVQLAEQINIYIRRGEIVMVHAGGTPELVSQAQAGGGRAGELPIAMQRESTRMLDEVLGAAAGRFWWQAVATLPDHVEAFGRPISVTSIALARQRRQAVGPKLDAKFLDEIYDRTPRFSEKLAGSRLEGDEQRLLGIIDGRTSVREILAKSNISSDRAAAIFARLRNVDLIRSDQTSGITDVDGGAVAVLDDDANGFIASVRAHLQKRPAPIETVVIGRANDLASIVLKQRVRMVLINSRMWTASGVAPTELAPLATAGNIVLVAVLDTPNPAELDAMISLGMHAVLVKPIHVNDLERLLSMP
ncbi:MAG TPA: response regulator [Kofleriaceae bacterium]|jgi:CheY-like chemotaxis protein